jgi:hypothetical protein
MVDADYRPARAPTCSGGGRLGTLQGCDGAGCPYGRIWRHGVEDVRGKSPFAGELTKVFGVPQDAVLGHAETLYPDYRKQMRPR